MLIQCLRPHRLLIRAKYVSRPDEFSGRFPLQSLQLLERWRLLYLTGVPGEYAFKITIHGNGNITRRLEFFKALSQIIPPTSNGSDA